MDLNALLRAHQIEAMKASSARNDEDRQCHSAAAAGYAELIRQSRYSFRKTTAQPSPDTSAQQSADPIVLKS